jgi:hypothetical protein
MTDEKAKQVQWWTVGIASDLYGGCFWEVTDCSDSAPDTDETRERKVIALADVLPALRALESVQKSLQWFANEHGLRFEIPQEIHHAIAVDLPFEIDEALAPFLSLLEVEK